MRGSLELVASTADRSLTPEHVGIEAGSMLYDERLFRQDGEHRRPNRVQATAGQVDVGEAVVVAVPQGDTRFREVGELELKGIAKPMRVFEAIANDGT